jgi:hypothetical protein
MSSDALLTSNDVAEALSKAYVNAIAARAGYVTAHKDFDRDGVDVTIEAGAAMRPKLDVQLKATINLGTPVSGVFRFPCPRRNYDLLREETQTPRLLVVLALPRQASYWLTVSSTHLVLRRCAYWVSLSGMPETTNSMSVTIDIPEANRLTVPVLQDLMDRSRRGSLT